MGWRVVVVTLSPTLAGFSEREQIFDMAASEGLRVAGMHLHFPASAI